MASSDFTTVFFDDFSGNTLDRGLWRSVYSGEYGNGAFSWTPDQIEIGGGLLTVAIEDGWGGWTAGGLSTIPNGQTYGSYEFRARIDDGQGTAGVILLWPSDNSWSDEIDIVETHRGDRQGFAFTNHGNPWETQYIGGVDVSDWHTYRLDWTPGELLLTVDGHEVGRMTHDVPDQDMSFGIQGHVLTDGESWYGGGPDGSTPGRVDIEVDWVSIAAYTPGSGEWSDEARSDSAQEDEWWNDWDANSADDGPTEGWSWFAAAEAYVESDGTWEGSWRNQVASGQISIADVASRLEAGLGSWEPWA